jgi:hypothetical protein
MAVKRSPKVTASRTTTIGLSSGEVNRKTIIGPNPARARINPFSIGMVEQLQNGVSAPIPAPSQ